MNDDQVQLISPRHSSAKSKRWSIALSTGLATSLIALSAQATVLTTGSISPGTLTTNPTTTSQIIVGIGAAGSLEVNANATGNGFTTVTGNFSGSVGVVSGFAAGSNGNILVDGNGTAGSATLTTPKSIIAGSSGGTGAITVQNGGLAQATGAGSVVQAGNSSSTGTINVTGANSALSSASRIQVGAFTSSNGTLNITGGADVQTGTNVGFSDGLVEIGTGESATGSVTVNGTGSTLATKGLLLGSGDVAGTITNTGSLSIQNGGSVSTDTSGIFVGSKTGSQITVTGAGSTLQVAALASGFQAGKEVIIGGFGQGTLLVEQNGAVNAAGANILVGGGFGGTNFDAATLTVASGGIVTANTVTVSQGGTLNGNGGTINGNVVLNGGTLAPGASPGIMDINGDLNLASGILNLEISSLLSDLLNVTGTVNFGTGLMINLIFDFQPPSGQTYDLANFFAGASALTFASGFDLEAQLDFIGLPTGSYITASLGGESVTVGQAPPTGVPEPASLALFGFGLLGLTALRRRRAA